MFRFCLQTLTVLHYLQTKSKINPYWLNNWRIKLYSRASLVCKKVKMCLYFSNNEYLIVYKLLKTNILFLLLFSTFPSERNNSSPSCWFKSRRSARKKFIFIHFHTFSHIFKHIHILPWSITLFPHLYMYFLHYFYYCLILH